MALRIIVVLLTIVLVCAAAWLAVRGTKQTVWDCGVVVASSCATAIALLEHGDAWLGVAAATLGVACLLVMVVRPRDGGLVFVKDARLPSIIRFIVPMAAFAALLVIGSLAWFNWIMIGVFGAIAVTAFWTVMRESIAYDKAAHQAAAERYAQMTRQVPSGWYPDPYDSSKLRWCAG